MKAKNIILSALVAVLFLGLTHTLLSGHTPNENPIPSADSSVFLYVGDSILEGQVPYRDVWDHKSPGIFYINALGLGLTGGSRWGIWMLEFASLFLTLSLLFILMRKIVGAWPALVTAAGFVFSLHFVLHGGNFTEEYALPLQVACLLLFYEQLHRPARWKLVTIGVLSALCFLLRPNLIGIPLVILGYYALQAVRVRSARVDLLAIVVAGLATLAAVSAYFWSQGALGVMWDAMVRYNLAYTFVRQGSRLTSLLSGMGRLTPVLSLAVAGWLTVLKGLRREPELLPKKARPFFGALLVCLPLEIILTGLPGRDYQHYFMSWLPVASVLAGFAIHTAVQTQREWLKRPGILYAGILAPLVVVIYVATAHQVSVVPFSILQGRGMPDVELPRGFRSSLEYIYENTAEDDYLLFWGNYLALHWIADRPSPTRFIYQSPFGVPSYVSDELVQELLADLQANPPLLIDTTVNDDPLPGLDSNLAELPPVLVPLYEYIQQNYQEETTLLSSDWTVYRYVGDASGN